MANAKKVLIIIRKTNRECTGNSGKWTSEVQCAAEIENLTDF
jgi:hypothetical protein